MRKTITCNNGLLSYTVTGNGKPAVFLHGLAEDGGLWDHQAAYLEKHFLLIIPDLPGSGHSLLTGDVSMEAMAAAVKCILDEEKITETAMIGHSMGGYVTLAFAARYPERLTALGLFHSTAYADGEEKKAVRKKNIAFVQLHGTQLYLKQSVPGLFSEDFKKEHPEVIQSIIDQFAYISPQSVAACQQAMIVRADRTEVLKNFGKPVLFIIGKHDNAVPFQHSLQLTHLPVISYIHILGYSGHMGMKEETEKTNRILEEFLQQVYALGAGAR